MLLNAKSGVLDFFGFGEVKHFTITRTFARKVFFGMSIVLGILIEGFDLNFSTDLTVFPFIIWKRRIHIKRIQYLLFVWNAYFPFKSFFSTFPASLKKSHTKDIEYHLSSFIIFFKCHIQPLSRELYSLMSSLLFKFAEAGEKKIPKFKQGNIL